MDRKPSDKELEQVVKISVLVLILTVLLIFPTRSLSAENEYDIVARNFLKHLRSDKTILSVQLIEANTLDDTLPAAAAAYLVNLDGGGYILISTSKLLTPIKAYSLKGDFETLPPAYRQFLLKEAEYNFRTAAAALRTTQSFGLSEAERRWDFLLNIDKYKTALEYTPDTYLLTTTWNQDDPYNKFLPEINGDKVLAGCVNIAVGQLMKYHGYPAAGRGVAYSSWNGQDLKAILYRPYNWQNMPDSLDAFQPEYKIDEVARLIRDLGIANHTDFNTTSSGTAGNISALIENFGYAKSIMHRDNTSESEFFNTLKAEIDALRPALLQFPGHMAVADGYSADGTGKKFHVNLGFGGHSDDYYYLDQNVTGENFDFSPDLGIIYNIMPCSNDSCAINLETNDSMGGATITGKFDYEFDADRYGVYLKGSTTISGARPGINNQAFFLEVYGSDNIRIALSDTAISDTFTAGKYTIQTSLLSETGAYTYDSLNPDYSVAISTEVLSDTEKADIDAALDIPPVIYNAFKDILLNASNSEPYKILIDARDENGDPLTLNVSNTNPNAVQTALTGNVLSLTPASGATGLAARIYVTATAENKSAAKSFAVMVVEDAAFGKTFAVNGVFENQEDYNTHRVILDGACTITGFNGYSNQAFYSSVLDSGGGTIISPVDGDMTGNFSAGIYLLGASLMENPGGFGSFYTYEAGEHAQYRLTVTCPDADESPAKVASLLAVDLSGTFDTTPPSPPSNLYSLPLENTWSNDNTIEIFWEAGTDAESGIAGYSYLWNMNSTTDPDLVVETASFSATSLPLADGDNHYFHVVAVNNSGTISSTVHLGPFRVDTTPPTGTLTYSTTDPTNQDVTVTLDPSEPITVTNNDGSTTYTFSKNGEFTFEFEDAAGNTGTATASVSNIDKLGDVNDDGIVDLIDAILVMQFLCSITPEQATYKLADINEDNKIGIEEVIYILQKVSKLR